MKILLAISEDKVQIIIDIFEGKIQGNTDKEKMTNLIKESVIRTVKNQKFNKMLKNFANETSESVFDLN